MGINENNVLSNLSVGFLLLFLSICVISVSAFVYVTAQVTVTQPVQRLVILTLSNNALGSIEEGVTIYYTPINQTDLDDILSINNPA